MQKIITQIVIAIFSVVGSFTIAWVLYQSELDQITSEFEQDVGQRVNTLENELVKTRATLRHWKSFYEAAGDIEPQQFSQIAFDVLESYPALDMIAWAPFVHGSQRAMFEKQFQSQAPGFGILGINQRFVMSKSAVSDQLLKQQLQRFDPRKIFVRSPEKEYYFPVMVVEPMQTAGFLIGLDMSAINRIDFDAQLMSSMSKGAVVGLPAAPSPFSPKHEPVFITLVPIQPENAGSTSQPIPENMTPEMMRKMEALMAQGGSQQILQQPPIKGFIAATLGIEKLIEHSMLVDLPEGIHFKLMDETGDDGLRLLYQTEEFATGLGKWYRRPLLETFDRKWVIMAAPKPGYIASRISMLPYGVVIGGLVFTALLLLYLNLLRRQAAVVQREVDERTVQLRDANDNLNLANARLETLSRIDSLTDVANRRFFNETIDKEWNRAQREGLPMALMIIDVDNFKGYNDLYGHLKGDECLQSVAATLKKVFSRSGDLVARYGGEEFAIILPNAGGEAMRMAEKCRAAIEALQVCHEDSPTAACVTISIGLSSVIPTADLKSDDLLDCADKGLYIAKEHGRNRVIYHTCHTRLSKVNQASG